MSKKVLFLGDVNNTLLTVAIGLSQAGVNVKYLPSLKLNQHYRFYDLLIAGVENIDIIEINNFDISEFKKEQIDKIKVKLKRFKDEGYIFVGSGLSPLVMEYSGLILDIFAVTGADLINQTKESHLKSHFKSFLKILRGKRKFLSSKKLAEIQTRGILNSKKIVSHSSGYFKHAPSNLKNLPHQIAPYPITYSKEYISGNDKDRIESKIIEKIINDVKLKSNYVLAMLSKIDPIKGSFVFIDGFSEYVKKINVSSTLLIPKRGRFDLVYQNSEKMRELITSGNIVTIPPLSQRAIFYIKSKIDVAFGINIGDFTKHDWNTTLMQTLQAQTPLITYCPFNTLCDIPNFDLYPHYNSKNSEQVKNGLIKFSDEKNRLLEKIKIKNWNIYMHHKSIKIWTNIIDKLS